MDEQKNEQVKSPEQIRADKEKIAAARLKRFNDNPDSFVEITELIVGARMGKEGIETIIGNFPRTPLTLAAGYIQQEVLDRITFIKMQQYKENQSRIVKPGNNGGRIKNFLKGGKGKVG